MGDKRNFAALEWVIGEISDTLKEARQSLEAYVEDPKDSTRIRFCLTHIHQVHGSLQMVEFHGASLLAEEMEQTAQAIMDDEVSNGLEAQEVLMRGLLQLPIFLEHIKSNKEDNPVRVMPLLNDLRAVRKQAYLSESNLFSPDLSSVGQASGAKHKIHQAPKELVATVTKLRKMYQYAAAAVLRDIEIEENLSHLDKVASRLAIISHGTKSYPLWEASAALIEALKRDDIEFTVAVRGLLRYLAREIRILNEKTLQVLDHAPNEGLLKNLLFYVARAEDGSEKVAKVKAKYKLNNALAGGGATEDPSELQDDMLQVPDAEAIRSVVVALQDELGSIKRVLDISLSGEGSSADIKEVLPTAKRVSDTLAVLGIGDLRKRMIEQSERLEDISEAEDIDEAKLMHIASNIIEIEHRLRAIAKSAGRHNDLNQVDEREVEIDSAKAAVIKECAAGLQRSKEAIIDYISNEWDKGQLADVGATLREIRGGLNMIPLRRPAAIVAVCADFIQNKIFDSDERPSHEAQQSLADIFVSIEAYLERLMQDMYEDSDDMLDIAENNANNLGYEIEIQASAADSEISHEALPEVDEGESEQEDYISEIQKAYSASGIAEPQTEFDTGADAAETPLPETSFNEAEATEPETDYEVASETVTPEAIVPETVTPETTALETTESEIPEPVSSFDEVEDTYISEPVEEATAEVDEDLSSEAEVAEEAIVEESTAEEPAAAEPAPVAPQAATPEPIPLEVNSDIDDEIIEIFVEEAGEVLETLEEYFPIWRGKPADQDSLVIIRRAFHTLKGSGRMVEAFDIGELAWSIENMLNRVIDRTIRATPHVFHIIEAVIAVTPTLVKAFENRYVNPQKELTSQYEAWAHQIAEGNPPAELEEPIPLFSETAAAAPVAEAPVEAPVQELPEDDSADNVVTDEVVIEEQAAEEPVAEELHSAEEESTQDEPPLSFEEDTSDDDSVDTVLQEIFSQESITHLATIDDFVANMEKEAPIYSVPTDALQRALHTLKGSAKMAQVWCIAEITEPLEHFTKELITFQLCVDDDILQLIRDAVEYIHQGLAMIEVGEEVKIAKVEQFIARANELRELAVGHLIVPNRVAVDQSPSKVDPRMLSLVMAEEMAQLLEADRLIERWQENNEATKPTDQDFGAMLDELSVLERGAEEANLPDMASLSHTLQSAYQLALAERIATDATFFSTMHNSHEALLDMVDAVAAGQNVVAPSSDLLTNITALIDSAKEEEVAEQVLETVVEDLAPVIETVDADATTETSFEADIAEVESTEVESTEVEAAEIESNEVSTDEAPEGNEQGDSELTPAEEYLESVFAEEESAFDETTDEIISVDESDVDEPEITFEFDSSSEGSEVTLDSDDETPLFESFDESEILSGEVELDPFTEGTDLQTEGSELQAEGSDIQAEGFEIEALSSDESSDEVETESDAIEAQSSEDGEPEIAVELEPELVSDTLEPTNVVNLADINLDDGAQEEEITFEAMSEGGEEPEAIDAEESELSFDSQDISTEEADFESTDIATTDDSEPVEEEIEIAFEGDDAEISFEGVDSPELVVSEEASADEADDSESMEEVSLEALESDAESIAIGEEANDELAEDTVEIEAESVEGLEEESESADLQAEEAQGDQSLDGQELSEKDPSDMDLDLGDLSIAEDLDDSLLESDSLDEEHSLESESNDLADLPEDEVAELPSLEVEDTVEDVSSDTPSTETVTETPADISSDSNVITIPGLLDDIDTNTEDFDQDILEIFIEEADELTEGLDEAIHTWQSNWHDGESLEEIKRILHTLKGGARLSGLTKFGDLTHDYETMLIEMGEDLSNVDEELFNKIHGFQDRVLSAVKGVKTFMESDFDVAIAAPIIDEATAPSAETEQGSGAVSEEAVSTDTSEASASAADSSVTDNNVTDNNVVKFEPKPKPAPKADDEFMMPTTSSDGNAAVAAGNVALKKAGPQEVVKVPAELLEELVNLAGETSINRSRLEQYVNDFGFALDEVDSTLNRLQDQLRRLDIETEAQILFRQEQMEAHDDFDPLEMDRYSHLQQLSRSLIESASDLTDLKIDLGDKLRVTETLLLQQSRINTTLQEGLMRSRMVPFSRMVPRLRRIVRQVATELGKNVSFELDNVEGELDRSVLERMVPPFEHMLRNAVDHGIESPEDRIAAGKAEAGRIVLTLAREGGDVIIRLADDGRGIDLKRVREKAIERELMSPDAELSDHDIMQFILHAGFSTAESVTQISGRGVGMDVVSAEIKQLGGAVTINSAWGKGTEFIVRLPFTLSVNRALMVAIGKDYYAIPLSSIEGIVRVSPFELEHYYANSEAQFEYANENYHVRYLGSLLHSGASASLDGHVLPLPVMLVRSAEHTMALQVDAVMGSREIVVKSLGQQFSSVAGLSGATVMGDGSVVVILDPHALVRQEIAKATSMLEQDMAQAALEDQEESRVKKIMVVDDSVTVRKVTTRFLEREGFEVVTAKDGVDALRLLQEGLPDLMLLDIEMPRMDGFEVAKTIRTTRRWENLPIVMITSRTGDKHRQHALSLGVNNYLGKPYQEDILLEAIGEILEQNV